MTKKKLLGWCVCGAMAAAFLSFFMDFFSYSIVGMSGFELMELASEYDEGMYMIISMVATVAGLVLALISNSKEGSFGLPMVCSIVSIICMGVFFSDGGMEYAGSGFWVFMLAHIAAVVLSVMANKEEF